MVNLCLKSYTFCLYLHVWIRIHNTAHYTPVPLCPGEDRICARDGWQLRSARQLDSAGGAGQEGQGKAAHHHQIQLFKFFEIVFFPLRVRLARRPIF